MSKLNATKEQWLTALESGDFEQSRHGRLRGWEDLSHLRNERQPGENFCCLGVMCEIAPNVTRNEVGGFEIAGEVSGIPETSMMAWLEFDNLPEWMSTNQHIACIRANDELGWTFAQIAEWWRKTDGAVTQNSNPDYSFSTN